MEVDIDKFWILALIVYATHTFSSVAGIFIIDKLGIGETIFHFTSDLKKMVVCSFLELLFPFILLYMFPPVLGVGITMCSLYFMSFWFLTKFAYLHISVPEVAVLGLANCAGLGLIGWTLIKHFIIVE